MKTYLTLFLAAVMLLFTGCATIDKAAIDTAKSVATVRDAFNSLLPSDFNGPVAISRHDAYFNISITASNVHKDKTDGLWHWTFCHYTRVTSIPITPAFAWHSDVEVTLGAQ